MAASTGMRNASAGLCIVSLLGVLGCGGDSPGASSALSPDQAYWALQFNQHAVTLALTAPQNTIQLTATPLNADGQPLALQNEAEIHYSTKDSMVAVDSTGLVTAKLVTASFAKVVATATDPVQHVTLTDTCYIQVTATASTSALTTFTIQPAAGSDTVMPVDKYFRMTAAARDGTGRTMANVFPYFTSSNPHIALIDKSTGAIQGGRVGQVTLYASTWAYGVAKRDSIALRIALPSAVQVNILPVTPTGSTHAVLTYWPQVITITQGGVVSWINRSATDSMDVVFDDPTNVDSVALNLFLGIGTGEGNIAPFVLDADATSDLAIKLCQRYGLYPDDCSDLVGFTFLEERQRKFPVVGTYHYHSILWGSNGTIVVQ